MPASSISSHPPPPPPPPPPAPAPRRRASACPARDAGVKGITRKVIRTLEALGHPDPALEAEADAEEDDDEHEVARALAADADARRAGAGKQRAVGETKKIDWEIPRKVFHSSIARSLFPANVSTGTQFSRGLLHHAGPVPDAEHVAADGGAAPLSSASMSVRWDSLCARASATERGDPSGNLIEAVTGIG
ncbi:hypothetical protein DFH09DRAFT_1448332 [Mycena vulgaris]|nr:hypothetical protein DFH09DRAFT_1448332 [Mycena vulgaris]